jgi:WD40 repeat protein
MSELTEREQRFQAALVALLDAAETGDLPSREAIAEEFPEFAVELSEFFANRASLDRMAAPLREAGTTVPSMGEQKNGKTIRYFGDYELVEELARGGMGVIYRARQVTLNRHVALKMISAGQLATTLDRQRFQAEAQAAAHLDHPNIVPIYEIGEHEGQHYFSMKLIEGGSLAEHVARFVADPRAAAQLLATTARAVHHAHQRGIMHRDLKPANILLDANGQPQVTDFGLAKRHASPALTTSGAIVGTPSYMAPEQAAAQKGLTTAADVYSLGAILYELLAGRPPFRRETALDTLREVLDRDPQPLRALQPRVDKDLETICLKCLEKDPARRYGSAEALAEDLEAWLRGEPIRARAASPWERAAKWVRRRPAAAWFLAFVLAAIVGTIVLWIRFSVQLHAALTETQHQKRLASDQAELARTRLWQSLVDQARAERLAGSRSNALAALAEAVRLRPAPELRGEAILAIAAPDLRLVCKLGPRQLFVGGEGPFLRFSADGRLLATAEVLETGDGSHTTDGIKVWEVPSGRLVAQAECSYYGGCFCFSPTSPVLALSQFGKDTVRIWDPSQDEIRARLPGTPPVCFSTDGKLLAVANGKRVRVWDLASNKPLSVEPLGKPGAFLSPVELVVQDGVRLHLWDVRAGKELFATPADGSAEVWSEDGHLAGVRAARSGQGGRVTIWDMKEGKQKTVVPGPGPLPYHSSLPLSAAGQLAAVADATEPYSARLIDLRTGTTRGRLVLPGFAGEAVYRGVFNPAGTLLAAMSGEQGSVRIWDVNTGKLLHTMPEQRCPAWSPDGRYLAVFASGWFEPEGSPHRRGGSDSHTRVYEVRAPTPSLRVSSAVEALNSSSDGQFLQAQGNRWALGSEPGSLTLRPAGPLADPHKRYFAGPAGQVWSMGPSRIKPPERVTLRQIAPKSREVTLPVRAEAGAVRYVAASPDGKSLVIVWERHIPLGPDNTGGHRLENQIEYWDVSGAEAVQRWVKSLTPAETPAVCFSPDGHEVAASSSSNIVFCNARTGDARVAKDVLMEAIAASHSVIHNVKHLRYSPDGSIVYCALDGGKIAAIDVALGTRTGLWQAHRGDMLALEISPDGKTLASGGEDRTLCLLDAATGRQLAQWEGHEARVTSVAFSRDGRLLASGDAEGNVKLWDLPEIRKQLRSLELDW